MFFKFNVLFCFLVLGSAMRIKLAVLADDRVKDYRFMSSFGFSCFIEVDGRSILFDVDSDWSVVKYNADVLGIDLLGVEAIVISHWHSDHCGGLSECLEWFSSNNRSVRVVVPSKRLGIDNEIECRRGLEIVPHVVSSGSVRRFGIGIEEQAVIIDTPKGPIIVTGCCHPGLDRFIDIALELTKKEKVFGVIGGLHIGYDEAFDLVPILRSVNVEFLAPCHCTGEDAIDLFEKEFGDKLIRVYVGKTMVFTT